MSGINPSRQRHPKAGAGPSLSENMWDIWVRHKSTYPNPPKHNQPGNFGQLITMITTLKELTDCLKCFRGRIFTINPNFDLIGDNLEDMEEFIFCKKGMTPEELYPPNRFGNWVECFYKEISTDVWKNECETMLMNNLNLSMPHIYGVKIDYSSDKQPKIFRWMAIKEYQGNPRFTDT